MEEGGIYRIHRYYGEMWDEKLQKRKVAALEDIEEACNIFHKTVEKKLRDQDFVLAPNGAVLPAPGLLDVFSPQVAKKPKVVIKKKSAGKPEVLYRKLSV
jgi:hypothetical protein